MLMYLIIYHMSLRFNAGLFTTICLLTYPLLFQIKLIPLWQKDCRTIKLSWGGLPLKPTLVTDLALFLWCYKDQKARISSCLKLLMRLHGLRQALYNDFYAVLRVGMPASSMPYFREELVFQILFPLYRLSKCAREEARLVVYSQLFSFADCLVHHANWRDDLEFTWSLPPVMS